MSPGTPEEARFRAQRRAALRRSGSVSALDYVESSGQADDRLVWRLRLQFLAQPPVGLSPHNLRVLNPAGEVDPGIQVTHLMITQDPPGSAEALLRVADPDRAGRLRGDSAHYRLEIEAPGVDRFFSSASFRFDGKLAMNDAAVEAPAELPSPGDIDYLAKDYDSFRQLMLERMAVHVPEWRERNAADIGMAIVEVLAYAADHLSYYQDAVATEAYLDTARRRSSVRRHLRLLGHVLHEGCNARVWVHLEIEGDRPLDLPAGTALLSRAGEMPPVLLDGSAQHAEALEQGSLNFETMHPARLWPRLNRMPLHSWGAADYRLPRGAVSLALSGHFPELEAGDVLLLEMRAAGGGEDADSRLRHVARIKSPPRLSEDPVGALPITEVDLFDEDALPFALPVSGGDGGQPGGELVACGNIVLADHGRTLQEELPTVRAAEPYRPALSASGITRGEPFDPAAACESPAALATQRPQQALAQVTLFELAGDGATPVGGSWLSRGDLLESPPFSADFTAETESDGTVRLRFGNGQQGRRPWPGTRFLAVYRVGNGPAGHLGHDSLAHIVSEDDLPVAAVRNPLPAWGAEPPEPLERARLVAPRAFRQNRNCVTAADLARLAESHPQVLNAVAELRWTGSWETMFLFVHRSDGLGLSAEFEGRLRSFLEPRLLTGADLEIRAPVPVALDIRLRVVVEPRAMRRSVGETLRERLGCGETADGGRGYFHPANFGFGQPAFLDGVLGEAMKAPGVVSVEAELFRPWGSDPALEPVRSSVEPGPLEIVVLRNRPAEPQLGLLGLSLEGGSS